MTGCPEADEANALNTRRSRHCFILSGREVARTFTKFGWQVTRQSSSHILMVKEGEVVTLS